jgi:hypothetical protein
MEASKTIYWIVVLVNEWYKTSDCGLLNEGLWIPNIWNSLYSKMKDLLVTKSSKRNCSIAIKFFRRFIAYCYTTILWNCHRVLVLFSHIFSQFIVFVTIEEMTEKLSQKLSQN